MLRTYRELASCAPSQQHDVYIYAIAPLVGNALAAITSADELVLLPRDTLSASNASRVKNVPQGLTSLVTTDGGTTAVCAGNDGVIAVFDVRMQSRAAQFLAGKPVTALACTGSDVAFGSEAVVSVWSVRCSRTRRSDHITNTASQGP